MPDIDATDLLVAAALVDVAATKAPHLRALADRLMAARDTHPPAPAPTPTQAPSGPQNAKEAS